MEKNFNIKDALETTNLFQLFDATGTSYKYDEINNVITVIVNSGEEVEMMSELVEDPDIFGAIEADKTEMDSMTIKVGTQEEKDEVEFSKYRMDPDKEKMYNPEENVVDYGEVFNFAFSTTKIGSVIHNDNKPKVTKDTLANLEDLFDDDEDWMNEEDN